MSSDLDSPQCPLEHGQRSKRPRIDRPPSISAWHGRCSRADPFTNGRRHRSELHLPEPDRRCGSLRAELRPGDVHGRAVLVPADIHRQRFLLQRLSDRIDDAFTLRTRHSPGRRECDYVSTRPCSVDFLFSFDKSRAAPTLTRVRYEPLRPHPMLTASQLRSNAAVCDWVLGSVPPP